MQFLFLQFKTTIYRINRIREVYKPTNASQLRALSNNVKPKQARRKRGLTWNRGVYDFAYRVNIFISNLLQPNAVYSFVLCIHL